MSQQVITNVVSVRCYAEFKCVCCGDVFTVVVDAPVDQSNGMIAGHVPFPGSIGRQLCDVCMTRAMGLNRNALDE